MDKNLTIDLCNYRLSQAKDCLSVAEINLEHGFFKDAANRSYYSIFHSMRAVLALDGFDSKKHSGVISEFRKRYIKTGKFSASFSDTIKDAFDLRTDSDYQDFYTVSKDDVQQQLENAKELMQAVQEFLDKSLEAIT